jgi:lipopolysaccharide assembly outer membrane protein LptD (OstA)
VRRFPISWVWLLAGALPLLAADEPPAPDEVPPSERSLTLRSEALSITPGQAVAYLRFSKGVTVSGEGFQLTADVVELDVNAGEVLQGLVVPQVPEDVEYIVREPGKTIADMGAELELPQAQFSQSNLRRVGAAGNVRVKNGEGVALTTAELISTDGGRAWAATGRSRLTRDDGAGNHAEMSADYLLLDSKANRALARGNIDGLVQQSGYQPVRFEAQSCEIDLAKQTLHVRDGFQAEFDELRLNCQTLFADLEKQVLYASDSPHLEGTGNDGADSVTVLDADRLELHLADRTALAQGHVRVVDRRGGIELTAGKIEADLEAMAYTASIQPELHYQDSSYTGTLITLTRKDKQTVIVVEGPQHAHINVEELTESGKDDGSAYAK